MSIIVDGKHRFTPNPEGGPFHAVCVDVVEMPAVQTQYGLKDKVRIVFETDQLMDPDENGEQKPFMISSFFTASIGEKAYLRKFLRQWRGQDFTLEEVEGFDLETIVGKPARIVVEHVIDGTNTYTNISTIMRASKGEVLEPSGCYTRVVDRPLQQDATQPVQNETPEKTTVRKLKFTPPAARTPIKQPKAKAAPVQKQETETEEGEEVSPF